LNAVPTTTGNSFNSIVDLRSDFLSSSAEIASPSRNLCRISSSFSATVSTSCVWNASAFFCSSAGISPTWILRVDGVVRPDDGLHGDQVHHSAKLVFLSNGNLNRDGLGVEALAEGIDRMLEIGTHLVDLVNETNSRDAVLVGLTPDFFRLRLDSMHRVKYGDGAVEHAQRAFHLGGKVHVAGRIDNVDANVAPGAGRGGRGNGDAALLLLLHPVHDGRAFVDLADTVRLSRIKQDALRRRGLPGIDVGHDADVPATF
jgi:hypothetical protein